jgi:hypothetical protein
MKTFQFQLDRVRRWRLEQLSLEELKLQQVRAARQALTDAKLQVREQLSRSREELLAQPTLHGQDLENLDSYGIHVQERVRDFESREQQWDAKVTEQRGRVLEARRRFELLDGLRKKAFDKWRAASDKEQETLAGELFLSKSTRNAG